MPQGGLDFLRVHVVEQAHGTVSLFDDRVEVCGPRVHAPLLRELRDRLALVRRILRASQEPDPIESLVHEKPDISCAGTLVRFDLGFERLPFRRIPKGREKLLRRELLGPLRERVTRAPARIASSTNAFILTRSSGVGGRSSKPIVASRTLPWPTRPAMLMPTPWAAMKSRYSPYVDQLQSWACA